MLDKHKQNSLARVGGYLKPMAILIITVALCLLFLMFYVGGNFLFIRAYTGYSVSSQPDATFSCIGFCIKENFALRFFTNCVLINLIVSVTAIPGGIANTK